MPILQEEMDDHITDRKILIAFLFMLLAVTVLTCLLGG